MSSKAVWDWDFRAVNPVDYEFFLYLNTHDHVMQSILKRSLPLLAKRGIKSTNIPLENVEAFEIPPPLLNQVKTYAQHLRRDAFRMIKNDGIIPLTFSIESCKFRRRLGTDVWDIIIKAVGSYTNKRA